MKLHQIVASDYNTALRSAHEQYGDGVRVVFRDDEQSGRLFSKRSRTTISFYVVAPPSQEG